MSNGSHRNDPHAHPDEGVEAGLGWYFRDRREQTAVPDFDHTLRQVEAESQRGAGRGRRLNLLPDGVSDVGGLWSRWLNGPRVLIGVGVLCLVVLARLLVSPDVTLPEADPVLLAQLQQTTLWVAPSDRWLKPASSPILLGIPDFSAMQFHMTETLTWSDLDG